MGAAGADGVAAYFPGAMLADRRVMQPAWQGPDAGSGVDLIAGSAVRYHIGPIFKPE